mmetsp:Transcript_8861/g.13007  ORF Transcript_8861/g.13007 Transcript_8861/m.13007 type:complete len:90 (-) Transcript_8861:415-684(-)
MLVSAEHVTIAGCMTIIFLALYYPTRLADNGLIVNILRLLPIMCDDAIHYFRGYPTTTMCWLSVFIKKADRVNHCMADIASFVNDDIAT